MTLRDQLLTKPGQARLMSADEVDLKRRQKRLQSLKNKLTDVSMNSPDQKQNKENSEKTEIAVRRAAMDLLARREHSFKELIQKLSSRIPG